MTTHDIETLRTAFRAYQKQVDLEADLFNLLAESSPAAAALKEQAGDYGRGWYAADNEEVDAADSMTEMRGPPAGSSAAFLAGWKDRLRQNLEIGHAWTTATDDEIRSALGDAFETILRRDGRGVAYVLSRGIGNVATQDTLEAAGARVWSYEPYDV